MATHSTPLLLLLDSVLSQDPERIREAKVRISESIEKAGVQTQNNSFSGTPSAPGTTASNSLVQDVELLLNIFPNVASIPSSHDGSLPLHFAASLGNVQVASMLFRAVS